MDEYNATEIQNFGTTAQLEQALSNLQLTTDAENDPLCIVCGNGIVVDDEITLYLYRPVETDGYAIGQYRCDNHNEDLVNLFTLGIDELLIDGRVGNCSDHATQQTYPVLIAPSIRLISAPDTTSGRVVSGHKQTHAKSPKEDGISDRSSDTLTASGGTQSVLSQANQDGSAAKSQPRSDWGANNE